MIEIKTPSRLEVLLNGLNSRIPKLTVTPRTTYVKEPQQLPSGNIVFITKESPIDTSQVLSKFRVNDFSINALTLSGAINKLKPTKLSGDTFTNLKNIETALESISSSLESVPTNVQPSNIQ